MKLRIGKRLLSYNYETEGWLETEVLNIDSTGDVRLRDKKGFVWTTDVKDMDDLESFRELK